MIRILAALVLLGAGTAAGYDIEVTYDIVYGKGWVTNPAPGLKDLKLDAYLPVGCPDTAKIACISIHGGGWKGGDKGGPAPIARDFAARGMAFFKINYRMMPDSLVCPNLVPGSGNLEMQGAYAAIVDAKAAIRWVRAHADSFGIDPERIVTMGGSAGGYTSAVLGLLDSDTLLNDGPDDPAIPYNHHGFNSKPNVCIETSGFVISWAPKFRDQFDSLDCPMCIIHGNMDDMIPFQGAYEFRTYCRIEKIPYELHIIDGAGHGDTWAPDTPDTVLDFIYEYLPDPATVSIRPDGRGTENSVPAAGGASVHTGHTRLFTVGGREVLTVHPAPGIYLRVSPAGIHKTVLLK